MLKFPVILASGRDRAELEVLPAYPAECPTCHRPGGLRDYKTPAKRAVEFLTTYCASGYYDALRDAIYEYEAQVGRAVTLAYRPL
jgi:hypothetical protein